MKYKFLLFTLAIFFTGFVSAQSYGIVGPAANGWPDAANPTPDIMLTDNGDGTYSIDNLQLTDGAAKFRSNEVWASDPADTPDYGGTGFPTGTADPNLGSPDIPVTAGNYDITLDLNNDTYSFVEVGPTMAAPTPSEDASNVESLYSDAYTDVAVANYDPDWGQSGFGQVNTMFDPAGNGSDFVLAYPNFNYQGTEIGSNLDLSDMDFLHVDIWVPAGTNRMVKVSPINNGTGPGEVLVEVPVTPGSWNSVALPKSDFTDGGGTEMTWDSVFQLKFDGQFNADGTANTTPFDVYVDNIYFSQTPATSTATTFDFENGLPSGWSNVDETSLGFDWEFTDGGTEFDLLSPFSGQVAIINSDEAGNNAGNVRASLISGPIDVSSFNNGVVLSFDHLFREFTNTSGKVLVSNDGGATYTLINEYTDNQGSFSGFSPVEITPVNAEFDITSAVGGASDIQIKFEYDDLGNWEYYWIVDNVVVEEAPSCIEPENLAASNPTTDSIDLTWDEESPSTATDGYEWVVMASGDAPDTGNAVETGTEANGTFTTNVTGLSSNTDYDAYVRSVCDAGATPPEVSEWSMVVSFSTLCTPFTAPYSTNFDTNNGNPIPDNGDLPDCWFGLINNASGTATLEIDDGSNSAAPTPFSAPNHVELTTDDTDDSVALISPEFSDLGDQDNRIRFYAQRDDHAGDLLIGTMTDPSDVNTFTLFETITNSELQDGTWSEFTVAFDTYTGGSAHIAFLQEEPNSFSDTYVDNFVYEEIPSCFKPDNLTTSNPTIDSVDLTWDEETPSTATDGYEWVVMASGDAPDTANAVATGTVGNGTLTDNVTGLSSNTEYDAYVRSVCDAASNDLSAWSTGASFTTLCTSFTAPYSENFDGVTSPAIPNCFSTIGNQASEVTTEESQFGIDNPPSASNFVLFGDDLNLNNGDEAILVSPQFTDLPDADNRIRFKAAFEDGDAESHQLFVGVMTDPTDVTTFVEVDVVTSSTDGSFVEYTVELSDQALIGSSEYIAIAGGSVAGFDEIALDDFVYEEIPSCDFPSNLQATNVTNNSIDLTWDAPSAAPANGYDWEIVPAGDGQGNNVVASGNEASTSVTATGLSGNTLYDAYVRSNCGSGDGESAYVGPVSFRTAPQPAQGLTCASGGDSSAVFSEEFDDNNAGWTGDVGSSNDNWEIPDDAGSTNTGADSAFSGSNYMNFEASNTSVSEGSIVSPAIDLSGGQAEAELSFWMHAYGEDMGTLEVGVGTSATGPFTNEFTWSGQLQTAGDDDWVNVGVNLDAYVGQTIYIELTQIDDGDSFEGDMSIDLFEVSTCVSCGIPSNFTVSNTTSSSADLNWDSVSSATDGYEWVVMASGDAPDTANAVETGTVANGTLTANVTNLTSDTDYDAYVRSVCDAASSQVSDWSGLESFSTLPDFCGGDNFFDNGGPNNDYEVDSDEVTTITPDNAGDVVTVEFLSFSTEQNYDGLLIYDGPDTSAPLIDSGFVNPGFGPLNDGTWNGDSTEPFTADGQTFTSSHPSGALTFRFVSDGTVTEAGWEANVTCGPAPTASVQVIHNSADPAAASVDVYLDGALLPELTGVDFRQASAFLDAPANVDITVDIVPAGDNLSNSVHTQTFNLAEDESYIIVADGVLDPSQFDDSVNTIDFGLEAYAGAQQTSTNAGEVSVLVHHGATDAPTVDVVNDNDQSILVDDISYTEFNGYLDLPTQDYVINVEAFDNSSVVQSYEANLQTLGLADTAITVVASGFLDPAANQNGEAFGLWVALPAGGSLVELPLATVGTDEFADNNFSYYPNPVEQRLNISSNGIVEDVQIFNMLGQEVIHVTPNTESPQINMSGLQAGAYMMKVNIEGASQSFRVIKK